MDKIDLQLGQTYHIPGRLPEPVLEPGKTALIIIDMQYLDAHRDGEYGKRARQYGIADEVEPFFDRLDRLVVPNIARLLEASRKAGIDVVYTRIASLRDDGKDMGWRYKEWGLVCNVDSFDAQILPEIAPQYNEIVIAKTATSAFVGSHIDRLLSNMGAECLIFCGVVTNGCVESSVRNAADLGYRVLLAEDSCAALSKQAHDNAVSAMHPVHAIAMSTDQILQKIEREVLGVQG